MPTDEKRNNDIIHVCPIMCGTCCDYWRDIPELTEDEPPDTVWNKCPNLTETGCKLPRNERPEECVAYLCTQAVNALFPDRVTQQVTKLVLDAVKD